MKVYIGIDLVGHLRFGHLEGEVPLTQDEIHKVQALLKKRSNYSISSAENEMLDDYLETITDNCSLVVDDYEIDTYDMDYRDIDFYE